MSPQNVISKIKTLEALLQVGAADVARPIHLGSVYGCFHTAVTQLRSDTDHTSTKAKTFTNWPFKENFAKPLL